MRREQEKRGLAALWRESSEWSEPQQEERN